MFQIIIFQCRDQQTLQTLRTSMIIPVDLNVFIFQVSYLHLWATSSSAFIFIFFIQYCFMQVLPFELDVSLTVLNCVLEQLEKNIQYFAKVLGNSTTEKWFTTAASQRQRAIQKILWNRKKGQWFDAWLSTNNCTVVNKVVRAQKISLSFFYA